MNAIVKTLNYHQSKLAEAEMLCGGDNDWHYSTQSQQVEYLKYVNQMVQDVPNWSKLTLTFATLPSANARNSVEKDYERFIQRMSSEIFKNAYKRYNKRTRTIACIEGGDAIDKRLHIHAMIEQPNRIVARDMKKMIERNWFNTSKNTGYARVEQVPTIEWVVYMLKRQSKDYKAGEYNEHIILL